MWRETKGSVGAEFAPGPGFGTSVLMNATEFGHLLYLIHRNWEMELIKVKNKGPTEVLWVVCNTDVKDVWEPAYQVMYTHRSLVQTWFFRQTKWDRTVLMGNHLRNLLKQYLCHYSFKQIACFVVYRVNNFSTVQFFSPYSSLQLFSIYCLSSCF